MTLPDYVSGLCYPSNMYMRYKETITQWEVVFGKENIIVIPYIEKENIINALARSLISPEIRLHGIAAYFENKSSGASAIEVLRLINKERSDQQQSGASKYRCAYLLFRIRNAIRKRTIKASQDRLHLSEDQLQRLNTIAEVDRLWLEERYRVRLENQHFGSTCFLSPVA